MAEQSKIEWTDATWNPIVGCSLVSPGCTNCYAMKMASRIEAMAVGAGRWSHYNGTTKASNGGAVWTGRVTLAPDHVLSLPLHWKRPRRIFVNSMGDLFHESVPDEWIDRVFVVMALARHHTFQVLTKRSARMRDYMIRFSWSRAVYSCRTSANDPVPVIVRHSYNDLQRKFGLTPRFSYDADCSSWPPNNVWLGGSAENQKAADERIPDLLVTPAAIRFVSCEPLLGPIDLGVIAALDWVIVGGESGAAARPMHPDWARSLRDQCAAAGVPFFMKQMTKKAPIPEDLLIREWPHDVIR